MSIEFDPVYPPFALPGGVPTPDTLPPPSWFRRMLEGQLRAAAGEAWVRIRERTPQWARLGTGMARVQDAVARALPDAGGRVPAVGDAAFAYLRFAGPHPIQITRARTLDEVPEKLRLDDARLQRILGPGASLSQRLAAGDVFVLRYDELDVRRAEDLQPGRFVAPVRALFCHAPDRDTPFAIVPVAIECPAASPEGPTVVVTPLDGGRWNGAKKLVNVADVNASEICTHLVRAHFMTAPFAIALRRTLPEGHPVRDFLAPHVQFDLFVHRMAYLQGVRDDRGVLCGSLAGSATFMHRVARGVYERQTFRDQNFVRDLAARGMDTHPAEYPYRDDGRLLWDAILRFSRACIETFYPDDRAVETDDALQAFVTEIASPEQGRVRGLLAGERLTTRDELAEILAQVLFTAGPLHALAHYGSAAQLQDPEENPSWLSANPLLDPAGADPGPLVAMAQFRRVVSTNVRHEALGDFRGHALERRPECAPHIARFQDDLRAAEDTIQRRNETRFAPFLHFLPSRITNGITV